MFCSMLEVSWAEGGVGRGRRRARHRKISWRLGGGRWLGRRGGGGPCRGRFSRFVRNEHPVGVMISERSGRTLVHLYPDRSARSLANGQLNGSVSKGSHKEDGLLRSKGLDGSGGYEDGPAKKR
ncbi:hypothetical protein WMY93_019898 [Mugilogobius chulae]|uniref:Uncharacterized protein n=1 Tax=Mugilogobius chulae TaxID=88201 RepID=A0AAW0NKI2_9GOBI